MPMGSASMPSRLSRPDTTEPTRSRSAPASASSLGRGRRKGTQHRQRQPGLGAGRVDSHVGGGAQPADAFRRLVPFREAVLPGFGGLGREVGDAHALARGVARVDPRLEVRGREIRKREHQVAEIALGIDADRGHAVDGGFFEQREAQARSCRCPSCRRTPRAWSGPSSRRGPGRPSRRWRPGRIHGRGRRRLTFRSPSDIGSSDRSSRNGDRHRFPRTENGASPRYFLRRAALAFFLRGAALRPRATCSCEAGRSPRSRSSCADRRGPPPSWWRPGARRRTPCPWPASSARSPRRSVMR